MARPVPSDGIPGDPSLRHGTPCQVLALTLVAALVTGVGAGINGLVQTADRATDETRFVAVADSMRAMDGWLRERGLTEVHDQVHAGLNRLRHLRFAPEE